MNHLRLLNKQNPTPEFYIGDIPALYLKNIKDLNIIIGANNTRKSRFMRQVIATEFKVLVSSEEDLNSIVQTASTIFEGISEKLIEVKLIGFIFNPPANPTDSYQAISNYFLEQIGDSKQLTFFDIRSTLNKILEQLESVGTEDNVAKLQLTINRAQVTFSLLLQLYKKLEHEEIFFDSPNPTGIEGITYKIVNGFTNYEIDELDEKTKILESVVKHIKVLNQLEITPYHDKNMVYIPVLRTSRRLGNSSTDLYKKTIEQQYKLSDTPKLSIETGLDLYDKIETARNGHRIDREQFTAFEKFISDVFFQSRPIDIIAVKSKSDSEKHVKISIQGEQDDIPIHDLGDGIQGIINLLFPVFTAKDGSWIFIDEPENHLHPGYQNIFMNAISGNEEIKKKALKFFVNTHSNHMLSEGLLGTANTEIFVFSRRDKDSSNIITFDGNEYTTLEMLGVFNTSVLISNCTVWIEGVTDRLYLKAFLFAYYNSKQPKFVPVEGLNYSFVEYAGNNLIHYSFDHQMTVNADDEEKNIKAFFINSNIFLLADSDFEQEQKHEFYKQQQKRKNFKYFQTELPEIENLLPESLLKSWLEHDVKCNTTEIEACFKTPICQQKLGAYFDQKFTRSKNNKRQFMRPAEGGTLRSDLKKRLAKYVHIGIMNKTITWEQLEESKIIKKLIIELNSFLLVKNQVTFTQ